jgi:hypothetical protein
MISFTCCFVSLIALRFHHYSTPRLRRPARSEPLRPARAEGANGGLDAVGASAYFQRQAAGLAPYDSGE